MGLYRPWVGRYEAIKTNEIITNFNNAPVDSVEQAKDTDLAI